MHRYRCSPEFCQASPRQASYRESSRGRAVKRSERERLGPPCGGARVETPQAKAIYRLRKQTVELQYADMKQNRNFRRLSGRGLTRVRIEVGLTELVYNLMIVERELRNRREANPATENTYVAASEQPDSL